MPRFVLTDLATETWVDAFRRTAGDFGWNLPAGWGVAKRTLRGGRRDGVDLVELHNGAMSLAVVPTRGLNLWRGQLGDTRLGWDSPVRDGPVHPAFVNLALGGGIGWIDGFDELLARCGLDHNGAPYTEGNTTYPLHGRIANIPAHLVVVEIDDQPPHAIHLIGQVDESRLFGPQVRLTSRLSLDAGSNRAVLTDTFSNLGDQPADLQILYHWNLGPPLLGAGARFVAPLKRVIPRNPRAVEGLDHHDTFGPPEPGFAEQVYFYELEGARPDGQTLALLRDPAGARGLALRFATAQLPCFTLWKNTGGAADGYVTGLEPATNYPNPKPFERSQGRVRVLPPGGSHTAVTVLEVLSTPGQVAAVEAEIAALQHQAGAPVIEPGPRPPFAPAP